MDLLPLFQWFYLTDVGVTIRNSVWLFPAIEAFHLLGFGLTAGAMLVVNLRLLGVGLTKQPVAQIAAGAEPWLILGVAMMVVSGVPLFLAEIDQMPLQLRLLDKDDLPRAGAPLHLHGLSSRDADEVGFRSYFDRTIGRGDIAGAVGRRRLGRALDRIFLNPTICYSGGSGHAR